MKKKIIIAVASFAAVGAAVAGYLHFSRRVQEMNQNKQPEQGIQMGGM